MEYDTSTPGPGAPGKGMMKKDRFPTNTSLLFYFLRGSKRYFALAISFAALVSVLDLVNPRIIGYTVDSVLGSAEDTLPDWVRGWIAGLGGTLWVKEHLWAVALLVIGVALGSMLCRFLFRLNNATGAETLVKRMRDLCSRPYYPPAVQVAQREQDRRHHPALHLRRGDDQDLPVGAPDLAPQSHRADRAGHVVFMFSMDPRLVWFRPRSSR